MAYTTIDDPTAFHQTKLYTGNDSSRAITFDGNTDMQPDWSWFKARSEAYNHAIFDSVRGVQKLIRSNQTNAEETHSTTLTAFGSNGFSLGGGDAFTNANNVTYASWHWKAGTSFTNDASSTGIGSIDSAGSVNQDAGFSIISFAGASAVSTVAHGLGVAPKMMIFKNRSDADHWGVYHQSLGSNAAMYLNLSGAVDGTLWNNTAPTTSVFTVQNNSAVNGSGNNIIAYCFAEKQGYSKFGSYTGNANNDGPYIHLGFKPAFLVIKQSSSERNWIMMDAKRSPFNIVTKYMKGNSSSAEETYNYVDFLSNGFKCRDSDTGANASGGTYIYYAFAENPFVTSSGVPATAR